MNSYFDQKELFLGPQVNQYGSHMIMTDVKKEKKTKYVNLDTRFRDEYNENFNINYNITLDEKIQDVITLTATNIEIPMFFYNICENFENNTIKITDNNTTTSAMLTLSDANYDETSIKAAINSKLASLAAPFSNITFDFIENKPRFTSSTGDEFTLEFAVDKNGNFAKYGIKSRLGWLLGYRKQYVIVPANGNVDGTALANISMPKYLYLCVDEVNNIGNLNKNKLGRISLDPVNYPFGTTLTASLANGYLVSDVRGYGKRNDIQKLNIQLVNDLDNVVNLNGQDISFYLKVEYE